MEHSIIPIKIDMKDIGNKMSGMVMEHSSIIMEPYILDSEHMAKKMDTANIFIKQVNDMKVIEKMTIKKEKVDSLIWMDPITQVPL